LKVWKKRRVLLAAGTGSAIFQQVLRPWRALNWPNRISLLRLLLVGPFILLLLNQNDPQCHWARHAALAIFAVMAVSDFLDGTMARRMNICTRLGAILDPLADKVLIICSVVLLAISESAVPGMLLPNWVVVAVVGKDLYVIVGFLVVYLVTDRFRVRPTPSGKICTLGQLVMVLAVLAGPDLNNLAAGAGTWLVGICCWAVAALAVLAVVSYTRQGLVFISEGQKPLDGHNPPGAATKVMCVNESDRRNPPGTQGRQDDRPGGR
jgi:cardiolipin synthase (CMP-forming)